MRPDRPGCTACLGSQKNIRGSLLIASDEPVAARNSFFAVEHSVVGEQNRGLQTLFSYFIFLLAGEHQVNEHPVPNDAKRLPLELLARQSDELVISKTGAAKHLSLAIQHILNQFCLHTAT